MNTTVKDENGNIYRINKELSSGGQGCVFTVKNNDSIVIKALVDENTLNIIEDENKYNLYKQNMRKVLAVGEFDHLAVPYVMLKKPLCGYVMLFMKGLQPIEKLMRPYLYKKRIDNYDTKQIYINNISDRDMVTACQKDEFYFSYNLTGGLIKRLKCLAKLAKIMGKFQDKNIVYCDLSPKNIFVSKNKDFSETWLIDLDNLRFGNDNFSPIGTPSFMAPEVVKGEKNTIYSDRYSFALIAFRLLVMSDPFYGNAADNYSSWEDNDIDDDGFETAVSRGEIAWICEKDDDSNRSKIGMNPYDLLNSSLMDLFERTLNKNGRNNPELRPSMWEWYESLVLAVESSSKGTLKLSGQSFTNLIKSTNKEKYYYQDINFITKTDPFQKSNKVNRLVVNIKDVVELSDDENNIEYVAIDDKKIFWDSNNDSNYFLSNYDVLKICQDEYVKDYIIISKKEELYRKSCEYNITVKSDDIDFIAVKNGSVVNSFQSLSNTSFYVKKDGKIIKKISISME